MRKCLFCKIFKRRKCCMPKRGDIVFYTDRFDSEAGETPNVSPALVVDVNADESLNLTVFFMNGSFWRTNVKKGDPSQRSTWHPKE